MRATRAYLAGLGPAGTLVLAASILFVLGSAVVAYNGWPKLGGIGSPATQTLTAHPKAGSHTSSSRGLAAVAVVKPLARAHAATAATVRARHTTSVVTHATHRSHRHSGSASIARPVAATPTHGSGTSTPTSGSGSTGTTPTTSTPAPVASSPAPVAATPAPVVNAGGAGTGSGRGSGSSSPSGTVTTIVNPGGTVTNPGSVATKPIGTPVISGTGSSGTGVKVVAGSHGTSYSGPVVSVNSTSISGSSSITKTSTVSTASTTSTTSTTVSAGSHGISVGIGGTSAPVVSSYSGSR